MQPTTEILAGSCFISHIGEVYTEPHVPVGIPVKKARLAEVLYLETVLDLYCYLKSLYLRGEVRFKPCKHCGRYFVLTGNGSTEYCNRPILGSTKTCRQIGAVRIY